MVTSAFSKNATFSAWLRCATRPDDGVEVGGVLHPLVLVR